MGSSQKYTEGVPQKPASLTTATISQASLDIMILRPVAYTSYKLAPTQQRCSAQEREALAIVQALQTWRDCIEGCEIYIRTDHESLAAIRKQKALPRRMQRFVGILENFNTKMFWRKGKTNYMADYRSRPSLMQTTVKSTSTKSLNVSIK